jgi:hypothetical protein
MRRGGRRTDVGPGIHEGRELLGASCTSFDGDEAGRCRFARCRRGRAAKRRESAWDLIELNERRRSPVN